MNLPALDARRAVEVVARFDGLHVLVVGDVMLDRFIVGRVSRISPEAPVPVVRFESEYLRLGGAANVAHNLVTLGGRVVARRYGRHRCGVDPRARLAGGVIGTWVAP